MQINNILDFFPFGDDERYRGKYLLDNTQNAKKWIVGKYREKFWCKYWNYTNNVVQWVYQQQKYIQNDLRKFYKKGRKYEKVKFSKE